MENILLVWLYFIFKQTPENEKTFSRKNILVQNKQSVKTKNFVQNSLPNVFLKSQKTLPTTSYASPFGWECM